MKVDLGVFAVDPGHDGAAVLLSTDGRTVLYVATWKRLKRKSGDVYTLRVWHTGADCCPRPDRASIHEIASDLREVSRFLPEGTEKYLLVMEELFADTSTRSSGSSIGVAEVAGELLGPLREGSTGTVERVNPSTWRSQILGIGQVSEAEAERIAIEWVKRGAIVDVSALGDLLDIDHVCAAICMAKWGWSKLKTPTVPSAPSRPKPPKNKKPDAENEKEKTK